MKSLTQKPSLCCSGSNCLNAPASGFPDCSLEYSNHGDSLKYASQYNTQDRGIAFFTGATKSLIRTYRSESQNFSHDLTLLASGYGPSNINMGGTTNNAKFNFYANLDDMGYVLDTAQNVASGSQTPNLINTAIDVNGLQSSTKRGVSIEISGSTSSRLTFHDIESGNNGASPYNTGNTFYMEWSSIVGRIATNENTIEIKPYVDGNGTPIDILPQLSYIKGNRGCT